MKTEILFFSAPWCVPCSQIKMQLTEEFINSNNIRIIDISEEESQTLVVDYKVMYVSTASTIDFATWIGFAAEKIRCANTRKANKGRYQI